MSKKSNPLECAREFGKRIIALTNDYDAKAKSAKFRNGMSVLIPSCMNYVDFVYLLNNPECIKIGSVGNLRGESVYASLEDALNGINEDGTKHVAFIEISAMLRMPVDYIGRDGKSFLPQELRERMADLNLRWAEKEYADYKEQKK